MNKSPHYLLVLVFIICSSIFAQKKSYTFERILIRDGLSQSSVFSVIQDHKGFIWIGTLDGLNKFDGYSFEIFRPIPGDTTSISHNSVFTLLEDSKNNLWVGTLGGGLNKFDYNSKTFTHYLSNNLPGYLSNNNVRSIYEDNEGNIWVGTDDGLNKLLENGSFENYKHDPNNQNSLSNNSIWDIEEDSNSRLFIGTYAGINIFDTKNNTFTRIQSLPGSRNSQNHDYIWDIEILNDNTAIVATDNGLLKLDVNQKKFIKYSIGLPSRNIDNYKAWQLLKDGNNLWVGTLANGLALYKIDEELNLSFVDLFINSPKNEESISQNYIWSMFKDNAGSIWIGTDLGLNRAFKTKGKFTHIKSDPYAENSLSSSEITSMIADNGYVWIGTRNGLNRYDIITHDVKIIKSDNSTILKNNYIRSILKDSENKLWIGTDGGGLTKFDEKENTVKHYLYTSQKNDISSNNVTSLFEDSNGILWVGTLSGLNQFDKKKEVFTHFLHETSNNKSISHNYIYSIYEDSDKNLWVGTLGGGLNLFNPSDSSFTRFDFSNRKNSSAGNNYIWTIYQDSKNRLWIGTNSGLEKYDYNLGELSKYLAIPQISNEAIYGILEDDNNFLWLSSNRGIVKFSPDSNLALFYDYRDGLQSNQFHGHAYCKSEDGRFYFGGINGFNYFFPDSIKINEFIPPVNVTRFDILNYNLNKNRQKEILSALNNAQPINLHYNENSLVLEFSAQNYILTEKNQYAYMMEGIDDKWIYSGKRRIVTYANLEPGNYIFKVKASNNDGIWNETGISIPINIIPPFWMTWWFIAFITVIIISIILLIIYDQFKHYLEIERLRLKIAEDLHDDIGTRLTEISMLTDIISRRSTNVENENNKSIKKVGDIARDLIDSLSDIVWLINPKRDSLYELLIKLRVTYEEILEHSDITLHINNLDFLEKRRLPIEYRKNLYLIFKEAFNNALKHSGCSEININASMSGKVLEIELEDNGKGFDIEKYKKGNGLNNMRHRAQQIGGIVEIASVKNSGTKIIFRGLINKLWKK